MAKNKKNRIELLVLQAAETQGISKEAIKAKIINSCDYSETRYSRILANTSQPTAAEKIVIMQILHITDEAQLYKE